MSVAARRTATTAALGALALLVFLLPALFNGHPFLFPDSVGYFRAGEATLHVLFPPEAIAAAAGEAGAAPAAGAIDPAKDGVSTARSPYYGVVVALAEAIGSQWLVAIAQSMLCIGALLLAARELGVGAERRQWLLAIAVGLVSGISVFATTIMPDVFAGLMLLAIALLLARRAEMGAAEQVFWFALLLIGCLSHKGLLAVAVLMLGAGLVLIRRVDRAALAGLAALAMVALGGHLLVDLAVERVTGQRPEQVPFPLARMIGDGTVPAYLDEACGREAYRLCAYRDRMPMTENEFLWSPLPDRGVMSVVPPAERAAILAEAGPVTIAALKAHPFRQLAAAARNSARQFLLVGTTEFAQRSGMEPWRAPGMADTLTAWLDSRVMTEAMPMAALSASMTLAYLGALAGLALIWWRSPAAFAPAAPDGLARLLLIAGMLFNAVVSGAISGVFDRYQGRVAWLAPMLLFAWLLARARRPAKAAAAATPELDPVSLES